MLLHDSYFLSTNETINKTYYDTITIAYSPLFHSTFTLVISLFGFVFNLTCFIKIWSVIYQYRVRKLQSRRSKQKQNSIHILSHKKYRFILTLTGNDVILSISSIISCLDEKFFFQSFLARHHLCSAHILIWKFTLHFIPLLIIMMLFRYHYILTRKFRLKSTALSTFKQLLCTDLSILIPIVLALAWSVDGLWLWGVANIKDYIIKIPPGINNQRLNRTEDITNSSISDNYKNLNSSITELLAFESEERIDRELYLKEQKHICYLQTNHNFRFTVRLVYLIQADFLLLFVLHAFAFFLEIYLYIRLYCLAATKRVPSYFAHERQKCIYILCIFSSITLMSLPFYFYRAIEILFDNQFSPTSNEILNSRTFAQILLFGACFKPILFFILFFPSCSLFKLKCYLTCYSPANLQIIEQAEQTLPVSHIENYVHREKQKQNSLRRHRYSLFLQPSSHPKPYVKQRTRSTPTIPAYRFRQDSLIRTSDYNRWLQLTHAVVINSTNDASNIQFV